MSKLSGVALVTGASTGIGAVYADRLAGRGLDLVLVARDRTKLEILATRLRSQTGRNVEVLPADLTDPTDLAAVEARLAKPDITVLVNNAGVASMAGLAQLPREGIDGMISLNILALTRLTHAALPGLIARKGAVINVSSVLSVLQMPTDGERPLMPWPKRVHPLPKGLIRGTRWTS